MAENKNWEILVKSQSYKQRRGKIRNSLLKHLEIKDAKREPFLDIVEQYMSLWDTACQLELDISERGVVVEGMHGMKKNDSVPEQQKVNKQMLSILAYLDMNPEVAADATGGDIDDTV
ncbi:P27 family phage terminase small subunit [Listeria monocytogenes]|nr:P27 family phage terminase small subunit [Listeria monocytogenes]HBJ8545876.1 P27 family phage terminase small subunit [Listeria monocytogenes]HBJ8604339.1 P27 family phage terminase small subunit [Listeria monocytogenes]HEL8334699.1 P27 family phage terminase small subunit [Listeria monocytogenes]